MLPTSPPKNYKISSAFSYNFILALTAQRLERTAKWVKIKMFLEQLAARDTLVQTWDEELWYTTVDFVTVRENKEMVFTFRDGRQVAISAEMWRVA